MQFGEARPKYDYLKLMTGLQRLCFSIPVASDRLFEKGTEKFLQSLREGELDGCKYVQRQREEIGSLGTSAHNSNLHKIRSTSQSHPYLWQFPRT